MSSIKFIKVTKDGYIEFARKINGFKSIGDAPTRIINIYTEDETDFYNIDNRIAVIYYKDDEINDEFEIRQDYIHLCSDNTILTTVQ